MSLLLALLVAALLTLVFVGVSRRRAWQLIGLFFLVVLLASWSAGLWIRPVGPAVLGVFWMPAVFVGVLVALLLVTLLREPTRQAPREGTTVELVEGKTKHEPADAGVRIIVRGALFIMVLFFAAAVLLGLMV